MTVDPTEGVLHPRYEGYAQSFIIEQPYPAPTDPSSRSRDHLTRTRLVYHAPERYTITGTERQTATIELAFPEAMPGHRPYYYELERQPPIGNHVIDTLRLYVDREVSIRFPRGTTARQARTTPRSNGPWGKWFSITVPDLTRPPLPGAELEYWTDSLHVLVHRSQNLAAVPQSRHDPVVMTPIVRNGPTRAVTAPGEGSHGTVQQLTRGVCEYRTTADGGAELVLRKQTLGVLGNMMGVGVTPMRAHRLAIVRVRYWNPEHRGRYHVQLGRAGRDLVVTVTLDANTYASLGVYGADESIISLVTGETLLERAQDELAGQGVQLRFVTRGHVPRPGERQRTEGQPWDRYVAGDGRRLYALRDQEADLVYDILSTAGGFIPILGDAFDIGQLVYALITGRDFIGREVSTTELLLMGLALVPLIPNVGRLSGRIGEGIARARELAARFPGGLDALRVIIRARRAARGAGSPEVARVAVASRMMRDLELVVRAP